MKTLNPRFRLRTLLIITTLLCVILMPISLHAYRARIQQQAVARLQSRLAYASYRIDSQEISVWHLKRAPSRSLSHWIAIHCGIDFAYPVTEVRAQKVCGAPPPTIVNDIALLPKLELISLSGVDLRNADVKPLGALGRLKSLEISECVLDDGPLHLLDSLQLTALNLRRTHVSDRSIRGLQNMQSLTYLNLDRTKVSDASVPMICQLKNLKTLYIGHSKVTKEGALRIKRVLPNCEVRWAPLSLTQNIPDSVLADE
jgi:Leucine-rich repeat (LRR) protein